MEAKRNKRSSHQNIDFGSRVKKLNKVFGLTSISWFSKKNSRFKTDTFRRGSSPCFCPYSEPSVIRPLTRLAGLVFWAVFKCQPSHRTVSYHCSTRRLQNVGKTLQISRTCIIYRLGKRDKACAKAPVPNTMANAKRWFWWTRLVKKKNLCRVVQMRPFEKKNNKKKTRSRLKTARNVVVYTRAHYRRTHGVTS